MAGLIDHIMESLQVDSLTRAEAEEALFYIDLHLDQDGNMAEVIQLFELKSKILDHLTELEKSSIS